MLQKKQIYNSLKITKSRKNSNATVFFDLLVHYNS